MVRLIDAKPDPVGQDVRLGRMERSHPRHEDAHRLPSPCRLPTRRRDHSCQPVNDVEIVCQVAIESGRPTSSTKVIITSNRVEEDQAESRAFFIVDRTKVNTSFRATQRRYVRKRIGDGFRIIDDAEVALTSKGDSRLPIPLRRIRVKRDKGATITLITNDLKRTAVEIAALYKSRWQIELLFRWIKQHLDIRTFLGTNETAIRLQVFAAMIAYLLLRLAARN